MTSPVHVLPSMAAIAFVLFLPTMLEAAANAASCDPADSLNRGWQTVAVRSGGLTRNVRVYVPSAARTERPPPLVFDLHGSGGSGQNQAQTSGLSKVAERNGFLVANPDGGIQQAQTPGAFFWHIPGVPLVRDTPVPPGAPDDVQFISDAMDQISAAMCVDQDRIYVTGFSGGARMTSLIACELASRVAAVAPVAGVRAGLPSSDDLSHPDPATCSPARPVPLITFHGVNDPVNPYAGGGAVYWSYPVAAALQRWVELNRCSSAAHERQISTDVTSIAYSNCGSDAEVIFYRIDAAADQGGGHVWPGGTRPNAAAASQAVDELNASELIWEFFSRHPGPARR